MKPALASIPAAGACLAVAARWWLQGSKNLYTVGSKQFYVADADLGWRLLPEGPMWLGLDALAVCLGLTAVVFVAGWILARWERTHGDLGWARRALLGASLAAWVIPIWAFASGARPAGAVDVPETAATAKTESGFAGHLSLPAGRYQAAPHAAAGVTASLRAGGEAFEARFAGNVTATFEGNPADLSQPLKVTVSVDAASVETGIDLRNKHAREALQTEKFPKITFELRSLRGTSAHGPDRVNFTGEGEVELMGRRHPVEVKGQAYAPNAEAKQRLELSAAEAMVIDASLDIQIDKTGVGNDGTFDANAIPIRARVVLLRSQ